MNEWKATLVIASHYTGRLTLAQLSGHCKGRRKKRRQKSIPFTFRMVHYIFRSLRNWTESSFGLFPQTVLKSQTFLELKVSPSDNDRTQFRGLLSVRKSKGLEFHLRVKAKGCWIVPRTVVAMWGLHISLKMDKQMQVYTGWKMFMQVWQQTIQFKHQQVHISRE